MEFKEVVKVIYVDTDDIMKEAIKIIEDSQNTNKKYSRTFNQMTKIKKQIANQYITNNDKIIFVGNG